MLSRTARIVVVGVGVAGFTLGSVPSAGAITWIVRNDDKQVGTEPGSTRPCEVAQSGGNGASHQTLGAEGVCWVVHPQAVEDHVNAHAIKGTWTE